MHLRRYFDAKYLMILPSIALILSITLFPFILNMILSLYNLYGIYMAVPPREKFCGVSNYIAMLTESFFHESALITAKYVLGTTALEFVLGFALALLVNSLPRGRKIITTFLILPLGVSPVIYSSVLRLALNADYGVVPYYINLICGTQVQPLGLGNALFTLILVDALQWSPFVFLILYAGLQALPREPFESALVDGASSFQIFRHITFPLLRPAIGVTLIFRSIGAFKAFDIVSILTGGGPVRTTTTLSYYIYQVFFHYHDVGKAAAASIVVATVLMFIFQGVSRILKSTGRT